MELVRFPSRGGFSVRSILTFALAVIVTALLWVTFSGPAAHAADAQWSQDAIVYENRGYTLDNAFVDATNTIPSGATIYKSRPQTNPNDSRKVFIIYFTAGVDPPTATDAKYVEFDYKNQTTSNPHNKRDISLDLKSNQTQGSSCNVGGVGWILCPATTWIATGMDWLFDKLSGMIATQPVVLGDSENSMYIAWNIMRTIANIAFVIVFLIIIYSQLTSAGISNYGLKRLIPRLIIAAVLVNISYYIAALAIDISNILGYSVQDVFVNIREGIFHITNDDIGSTLSTDGGWAHITSIILAGGGVYAGIAYLSPTIGGGIFMLAPLLAGLLITVMLVFIILAARQAIILILVIIAPIAFVANLLPNTEKWFDKWKDLFMTMLIFFPAFSLVFGGSQLAGQIIIQNAGGDIVILLFGLAVQVAPLVITPLILKLSGGLLGKIAQIANNPSKGLVDRSRNWANDRAKLSRTDSLHKKHNPVMRPAALVARRVNHSNRLLKSKLAASEVEATNDFEEKNKRYGEVHKRQALADKNKQSIHDEHAAHISTLELTPGTKLHAASIRASAAKDNLTAQERNVAGYHDTLRTVGGTSLNQSALNLATAEASAGAADKQKEAYLNQQRTFRFTELGAAAERLEVAKLQAEGWQSKYTAHMDSLKVENAAGVVPNTSLANAAVFAQSSKEHAEAAQNQVQVMFERQRTVQGSELNVSNLKLEDMKLQAEEAKSFTAQYVADQKSTLEGVLHVQNARTEEAKLAMQNAEARVKSVIEEYKAGAVPEGADDTLTRIIEGIREQREEVAIEDRRTSNAVKVQNDNIANSLIKDEDLRNYAGGIDEQGAQSALANAITTVRSAYEQSVNEARQIVKHFNLSSEQRQKLALGETVSAVRDDGTTYEFTPENLYAREAAIEEQIAVGTIDQVEAIVRSSGTDAASRVDANGNPLPDLSGFRTTIAAALAKNSLGGKSLYLGGKTIDDVGKGTVSGEEGIMQIAIETIGKGKIAEKDLAGIDPLAVERLLGAARRIKAGDYPASMGIDPTTPEGQEKIRDYEHRLAQLSLSARKTLTGDERVNVKAKAVEFIEEMGRFTESDFKAPEDD